MPVFLKKKPQRFMVQISMQSEIGTAHLLPKCLLWVLEHFWNREPLWVTRTSYSLGFSEILNPYNSLRHLKRIFYPTDQCFSNLKGLQSGVSNSQPTGHMRPRMAMNVAQQKILNLVKTFLLISFP